MSSRPSSAMALSMTAINKGSVKSYHTAYHSNTTNHGQTKLLPQVVFNCYYIQLLLSHSESSQKNKILSHSETLTEDDARCLFVAQHGDPMLYQRVRRDEHLRKKHVTPCHPHTTRGNHLKRIRTCQMPYG